MPATLTLTTDPTHVLTADSLVAIGRRARFGADAPGTLLPADVDPAVVAAMAGSIDPGDGGRTATTWLTDPVRHLTLAVLPDACSRLNTPSRALAIPDLLGAAGTRGRLGIVVAVDRPDHAFAAVLGVARAFPLYTATSRDDPDRRVDVIVIGPDGPVAAPGLQEALDAVRSAASWVDAPPDRFNVDAFVARASAIADHHPDVAIHVVRGGALLEQGLGGLHAVGRAGREAPALVVLDHAPEGARSAMAWVGKGIVYDTGGLSLKTKTGMPGMKSDMAGAAAVLAAFDAAVSLGAPHRLTAVLCIAENAIGPAALRPDDVLRLLSGRTVEVNNTDAEGRLVLADGVAWAVRYRKPEVLVDVATLTGAQSMATGRRVAAVISNDADLEHRAVAAGRASGDLVHPLPYLPELLRGEFRSRVADMKNSVKDRGNAQTSCAGQFIANHLGDFAGSWLHVDMAGPSMRRGRATGWGVGLLLTLAGVGAPLP